MDAPLPYSPADLPLVTLDNNALIAVRDGTGEGEAVNELLTMNRLGQIIINVTVSTALENPHNGVRREMREEVARLEQLGIARCHAFSGPRTIGFASSAEPGVTFFDPQQEMWLSQEIHRILAPSVSYYWHEFRNDRCAKEGLSLDAMAEYDLEQTHLYIPPTPHHPLQCPTPHFDALSLEEQHCIRETHRRLQRDWDNAKCDSLGLYNHLTNAAHTTHPEWSVFVTSDKHFLKATALPRLRKLGFSGEILPPVQALAFLAKVSR